MFHIYQPIIALGLSLWDYIEIVIGITTLTVPLIGGSWVTREKHERLFNVSVACACIGCILIMYASICNHKWCVVPNLYGKSYSNAINTLYDSGLNGMELLPMPKQLDEYSNVVWQSKEKDSISLKGTTVFFVLDNNTKYEKSPISKPLGPIDSRIWSWEKCDAKIKLMLPQTYSTMKTDKPNAVTFDVYVECLAETLVEIVMDYCDSNRIDVQINPQKFEDYSFVGRLHANDENDPKMQCVKTASINGAILLPIIMKDNDYGFCFSFYDEDGNHYDHVIPIEFISEYEWNHT